ncbi:MAG: type II toxin-antitoxin system VapC family toxin [Moraxella sp.]|nr:type II toxin-antitoxin system VapC family toxin [Moraxella sp.]
MKAGYALDTHIFIWINHSPSKLNANFQKILRNTDNSFFLSMVSLWEMQIKIQLGKLTNLPSLSKLIEQNKRDNIYKILPIKETHILGLQALPPIHKDPFDRLLISQAISENLILLTADSNIIQYPVGLAY